MKFYRAKKRMDGEDVYGCKISVDFAAAIEALPVKPGKKFSFQDLYLLKYFTTSVCF